MRCALEVNGAPVDIDVEPREVLVDVLRERLRLTGTKVGCDTAQCGSCVVELDGQSVKSCQVLAVSAEGSQVVTIEGVAGDGDLTAVQASLSAEHGVQCGFCVPGVVMSLREVFRTTPTPTRDEVVAGLAGNLCRCTGYVAVVQAALDVARQSRDGAAPASAGAPAPAAGQVATEPATAVAP